ncbi:MAG: DUF721 domain-containing protein [Gammaproteobacteria bacterium]|nr:DUF721 domain-containing protein [Gammaproteobacteria bacterium]
MCNFIFIYLESEFTHNSDVSFWNVRNAPGNIKLKSAHTIHLPSMKSSRSLDKLFEEAHGDLAILVTRTRQLMRWTALLRTKLDQELAPHCYLGELQETSLSIFVDSAAWATRLRFQIPQVISALRMANPIFAKLENIKVKVLTQEHSQDLDAIQSSGPVMSTDNARNINSLSESIEDPALQQALQRLARNAARK